MVLTPRRSRSPAHRPLDLGRAGRPVVAASLQALQCQAGELAEHLAVALGGLGRLFDEQSAPVPRVGDPADVPRPFQAIDDRRDASGGEPDPAGQLRRGQRPELPDDIQAAHVGGVEAIPIRRDVVEQIDLGAQRPERREHLLLGWPGHIT
jgi:hypothetical protein